MSLNLLIHSSELLGVLYCTDFCGCALLQGLLL